MAEKNKIIVQLASPERLFTKCYHDFLESKLLDGNEKFMFIVLKRFLDVKLDNGEVFPTIDTMCKITGWERKKVMKTIQKLVKKGIIKKVQRGLTKANIYILSDYPSMWDCETLEELKAVAENEGVKPLTPEQHIAELKKMGYIVEIKEKEIVDEPAKEQKQSLKKSKLCNKNTTKKEESQEKYTIEQVKVFYDYAIMVNDRPLYKDDIDTVINILYDTLNTKKETIRVQGEDKPATVVISKLMKLDYEHIFYVIDKFNEQTERIKNPTSYMLTLLYKAKEQMRLDVTNQVQYDMYNWNSQMETE